MSKIQDETASGDARASGPRRGGSEGKSKDTNHPEEDPVEGSRETVEHELDRSERSGPGKSPDEGDRARRALRRQVEEETQLPQRGSA